MSLVAPTAEGQSRAACQVREKQAAPYSSAARSLRCAWRPTCTGLSLGASACHSACLFLLCMHAHATQGLQPWRPVFAILHACLGCARSSVRITTAAPAASDARRHTALPHACSTLDDHPCRGCPRCLFTTAASSDAPPPVFNKARGHTCALVRLCIAALLP